LRSPPTRSEVSVADARVSGPSCHQKSRTRRSQVVRRSPSDRVKQSSVRCVADPLIGAPLPCRSRNTLTAKWAPTAHFVSYSVAPQTKSTGIKHGPFEATPAASLI
jgi:hypothetical protein